MLSKKKDSGINDGIAGKYVKRETPPMLRSKFHLSVYKRTDIKYIVICSTVNLILTTVSWCAQVLQLWNTFYMKRETINILWTACSRLECTNNTNESSQRIANLCSMSFIIRAPLLATYLLYIACTDQECYCV